MKNSSWAFTQGGQIHTHNLRMLQQVIGSTLKVGLWIAVAVFVGLIYYDHPWQEFWLVGVYAKAWFMTNCPETISSFSPSSLIHMMDGSSQYFSDRMIMGSEHFHNQMQYFMWSGIKKLIQSLLVGVVGAVLLSWFWTRKGRKSQEKEIISGLELVTPEELAERVRNDEEGASHYEIVNIPLPKYQEFTHFLINGSTGSGKSVMISRFLAQVRFHGDQAIVVDTTGALLSSFYHEERDILLNPLDKRSTPWNMWKELTKETLVEEVSAALVPPDPQQKAFWYKNARTILSETIMSLMDQDRMTYKDLVRTILMIPLKDLGRMIKDTPAESLINGSIEETAASFRATLVESIKGFTKMEDTKDGISFLNKLANPEDKGWIFLACLSDQREFLRSIFSVQLSLIIKGIMRRPIVPDDKKQRIWIVIDELASLNALPSLQTALEEVRKHGGCVILGFQDFGQLDVIYGHETVNTFSNLTGTKILLRCNDVKLAERNAKYFGEQEVRETSESLSFGAHQMRDGVSLSERIYKKPLITATDMSKLKKLQAYVKFAGDFPIAKIKIPYLIRTQDEPAFIEKEEKIPFYKRAARNLSGTEEKEPSVSTHETLKPIPMPLEEADGTIENTPEQKD
jgi:type IV conjugative transfer system coupling protein TraD